MVSGIVTDEKFDVMYPEEYYSERLCGHDEVRGAIVIANEIYKYFSPKSVVDIGCGVAMELFNFKKLGVKVLGIDRSNFAKKHAFINEFEVWDLRNSYNFREKFDVCISFDFIEHVEPEYENIVLDNIVNSSDIAIISVPYPSGDPLHYNEQPREYWIEAFKRRDYYYDSMATTVLKEKTLGSRYWAPQYMQVFRRIKNEN